MISLTEQFSDIKLKRNEVSYYQNFFTLKKYFDFNSLAFCFDRKEDNNNFYDNGKVKLTNFEMFDEGREICNLVDNLQEDRNFKTVNALIFASWSKIGQSLTHEDQENVFLFGVHGSSIYNIYSGMNYQSYFLNVGDLLVIPKETLHSAMPLGSRIAVSVGVYD